MFQEMRDSGASRLFEAGPCAVKHGAGDQGLSRIGPSRDFQAVWTSSELDRFRGEQGLQLLLTFISV